MSSNYNTRTVRIKEIVTIVKQGKSKRRLIETEKQKEVEGGKGKRKIQTERGKGRKVGTEKRK